MSEKPTPPWANEIPEGSSPAELQKRHDLIVEYYKTWRVNNPTQRVFNQSLHDYINIRQISVDETARHASKTYLSTLAGSSVGRNPCLRKEGACGKD